MFSALALQRHARLLTTGYDLGIFEQEVRSYAAGHLPTSLLKGIDYPLLGDHFSPIVSLLAPLYLVHPGSETLLVGQAVLLTLGVVPLAGWAARSLGPGAAAVVAAAYGLVGGLAHAIAFDFHEIAFAVPLLAFSLTALGRGRLRAAALWAAPLVLVKEDLGLTVTAIGLLIATRAWRTDARGRLLGLAAAAFGAAATAIETMLVIPALNPAGGNSYTGQLTPASAAHQLATLLTDDTRIGTVVALLLPTAFLALRSPLVLAAIPTLAWRFLSDNPNYWGTSFHYDAVLVPVVTAAFIDGLIRLRRSEHPNPAADGPSLRTWHDRPTSRTWPGRPSRGITRTGLALAASLALVLALLPASPLATLASPAFWAPSPHAEAARSILDRIPDGSTVAASNSLAPQLTARTEVSLLGILPVDVTRPDYVVADTSIAQQFPVGGAALADLAAAAEVSGYHLAARADGVILLEREPEAPPAVLDPSVVVAKKAR